jgi:8-oxo-dGTP pyrophosphatase MutT (NUDIX family)
MPEEFFTVVGRKDPRDPQSEIIVGGCVTRHLAHSPARIPHAAVQIIPVRCGTGTIIIHQRSSKVRTSHERWDFFGGHVSFELGILLSAHGLEEASLETAVREAREELLVTVDNRPHLFQQAHFRRIGGVGEFEWGIDDPQSENVEYSTAFTVCIPEKAILGQSPFELRSGEIEWLQVKEIVWDDLLALYRTSQTSPQSQQVTQNEFRTGFSDGVARILNRVQISDAMRHEVEAAINWCKAAPM